MDNRRVSSTEIASITLNDAPQNLESQNCKIHKCHSEKRDDTLNEVDTRNVNDPVNVPAICLETSDEDDVSEGLTLGDVERTETQLLLETNLGAAIDCGKEFASALQERAQKLWSEMTSLQEKLSKETALWRKEKEEFQLLRERSDALAFEEAAAAARAAAIAYAVESPLSSDLSNFDITSERSIRELAILEYEKNLAKYHDQQFFEHAEQRYNSYKRVLVDAYRQKLSEVERLCDEELENIQQTASCLQPFKKIAAQWSVDKNDHGDSQRGCDNLSDGFVETLKIIETSPSNSRCIYGKVDNEVNMIPEILSARFKEAT